MTTNPQGTPIGQSNRRERSIIVGVAATVAVLVAASLGLRSSPDASGAFGTLLPYQMLIQDLVPADQAVVDRLRQSLLDAESGRTRTGQWPPASEIGALSTSVQPADESTPTSSYAWTFTQQAVIVNYLGLPQDASAAAWLIRIQEPDPLTSTDTAPNDEEHHRLPDGTVLHVSIWMHRFGGQMKPDFFTKPENAGWTQLLTAPVNPVAPRGTTR